MADLVVADLRVGDPVVYEVTDKLDADRPRRYRAVVDKIEEGVVHVIWTNDHGKQHRAEFWQDSGRHKHWNQIGLYAYRLDHPRTPQEIAGG